MKKITLWLFALFTCSQISAQVGGYSFTEGVGAYAALGGTNITATGDDGTQNALPIGFTFKYGGTDYTTFSVTTNGWIRLGGDIPGSAWTNDAANFASANYRPLIAAIWDDNHRNTGAITYSVSGASPNQILTVDYNNVNIGGTGSTSGTNLANYQIKLYETTNVIEFHYGTMATAGTLSATIGLSDTSGFQSVTPGTPGTSSNATGNHAISAVTNIANKMYRFTPPACTAPNGLNTTSITTSTATIAWNAAVPAPATGYEYVVSTSNTAPAGAGTPTTNLSEAISLLSPQTTYYLFVRSDCGGIFSPWVSSSFTTLCVPIVTLPWTESFEGLAIGNNIFPVCWAFSNTTSNWNIETNPVAHTGVNSLGRTWSTDGWAFTPLTTLTAGTSYRFSYYIRTQDNVVGYDITIGVGNDQTSAGMTTTLSTVTGYQNPTWTKVNHEFTPSVTGDYSFGVHVVAPGAPNGINFDDFVLELTPTCPDQTGLVVGNITSSGADTSWDDLSGNGSVGYEYAITTSATPPASGTPTAATFYIASGLASQTLHYLHVRSECAGSTYGNWATKSFTTACTSVANFNENFDAVTTPALPTCWSKILSGATLSTFATVNTATTNASAPYGVELYNSSSAATDNIMLVTPMLSNLSAGTHRLKFKARNSVATQDLEIGVLTNPADAATFTLVQSVDITTTFQSYVVNFDTFTAPGAAIALRRLSTSTYTYVYLDDIVWEVMPTCPDQTGLVVGNITSSGADTSWDDLSGSGVTGYEYAVTTSATPPASGTPTSVTFYIASGLAPQTVHYLHVRTDCGAGSFGVWISIPFTTQCAPITTLPWNEGFEGLATVGANSFPPCWFKQNGDWTSQNTNDAYSTANTGTRYIRDSWSATNEFMWTPGFDLIAGTSYDFSSFVQGDNGTGWIVDYFVNNAQSSTGATQLGASYNVPGAGTPYAFQPYAQITRSFVPATSGTYYFAVRVNQSSSAPWYVTFDDFELKLSPACPTPSASAGSVTDASANITWAAVPSATLGYEYVLDNVATDPAGSGTSTMALAYPASGLTQSTVYYFHIRSVCSAGTYSTWSTVSFTTLATPPVNDNCSSAIALTPGATFATNPLIATNVGATGSTETAPGCASYDGGDVWYSVIVPASGNITVETGTNTGTTITDTGLAVYSGACGALVLVECDDDDGTVGNFSLVSLTGRTPGELLYIRAWEYDNDIFNTFTVSAYDASLSSASFDKSTFVAYPNPVKDILNLSYKTAISNVRVINLLGQEVLNTKTNSNDVQVNMSALTAGAYIMNITVEDTVHTIKVIKE